MFKYSSTFFSCINKLNHYSPEEAAGKNGLKNQEQEIKQEKEAKEDNEVKPNKQITNLADSTNVADANKENEDEEPKPKRQKLERCEEGAESSKELSAENTATEVQENHDETVAAKKNKKKKKKKMLQHDDAALEYEAETLPLQVMSK